MDLYLQNHYSESGTGRERVQGLSRLLLDLPIIPGEKEVLKSIVLMGVFRLLTLGLLVMSTSCRSTHS